MGGWGRGAVGSLLRGLGCSEGRGGREDCAGGRLTEQDLQGSGVQLQVLGLLLHHVHLLRVLVVEAVHAGIGQHLGEPESGLSRLRRGTRLPPVSSLPPAKQVRGQLPSPLDPLGTSLPSPTQPQPFEPAQVPGKRR